jgi:hypothetical protein
VFDAIQRVASAGLWYYHIADGESYKVDRIEKHGAIRRKITTKIIEYFF